MQICAHHFGHHNATRRQAAALRSSYTRRMKSNIRFPGESDAYRDARNELLESEAELRRAVERVSELRRQLPLGGVIPEDYLFDSASG